MNWFLLVAILNLVSAIYNIWYYWILKNKAQELELKRKVLDEKIMETRERVEEGYAPYTSTLDEVVKEESECVGNLSIVKETLAEKIRKKKEKYEKKVVDMILESLAENPRDWVVKNIDGDCAIIKEGIAVNASYICKKKSIVINLNVTEKSIKVFVELRGRVISLHVSNESIIWTALKEWGDIVKCLNETEVYEDFFEEAKEDKIERTIPIINGIEIEKNEEN